MNWLRLSAFALPVACLVLVGLSANATPLCATFPNNLTNGTTADAAQVMANFNCAVLTSEVYTSSANAVTAVGNSPGSAFTTTVHTTAMGTGALSNPSLTGTVNNAFGSFSLYSLTSGGENSAFATGALQNDTTGSSNSGFGYNALVGVSSGSFNTAIGNAAGASVNGTKNTFLGANADGSGSISNATAVGADVIITNSNTVILGHSANVGIGTTAPAQALEVNGKIQVDVLASASGTNLCINAGVISNCSSSLRYKENIQSATFGLGEVMAMRPVTFKWKGRDENDFGFIAEEMAKINPLYVTHVNGRIEGVKYPQLTAVLVNAVKELKVANDNQNKEIRQLERQVKDLQTKLLVRTAQR